MRSKVVTLTTTLQTQAPGHMERVKKDPPEEEPRLAQLERLEVIFLHQRDAEDIRGGEQPAAPAAPLVGDGRALEGDSDVVHLLVGDLGGARGEHVSGVSGGEGGQGESAKAPTKRRVD